MSAESERVTAYQQTIARIEPEIAMIDAATYHASAAISLKRIADALEYFAQLTREERQNP